MEIGVIKASDLTAWNSAIGLRNRILHDYMNIDMAWVLELVKMSSAGLSRTQILADTH